MYRFDIINSFIKKHKFEKYLEIGVSSGDCIRRIECRDKDGVDPGSEGFTAPETNFILPSDEFFSQNQKIYDIVFIDGLHHSDQVDKDILNSLNCTIDKGIIILHDCNPPTLNHSLVPRIQSNWNGDVYKSVLRFQKGNKKHTFFTVDTDWGVGVILKNTSFTPIVGDEEYQRGIDDWDYFDSNRNRLLNLISVEMFENQYC